MPFASAKVSTPMFVVKAPKTYGLFKKLGEAKPLSDGFYIDFNILQLFKVALIKSRSLQASNQFRALFLYFFSFVGTYSAGKVWCSNKNAFFYYFYLPLGARVLYTLRWV